MAEPAVAGWVLIAAALLVAIIAIVWTLARRYERKEYERERVPPTPPIPPAQQLTQTANPHNENTFTPTQIFNIGGQSQSQSQVQAQTQSERPLRHRADSVFEATENARIETYGFNAQTGRLIREPYYGKDEDLPENINMVRVALAQFHYRHDPNVEPSLNVGAQIFPYGMDKKPLKPLVYHAIWDTEDLDRQISFDAGYAQDLVVALIPKRDDAEVVVLFEHGTQKIQDYMGSDVVVTPKLHEINGKDFYIEVYLTPKRYGELLTKQEFWFRLTLGTPPTFVKIGCPLLRAHPRNTVRIPPG